MKRKVIAIDEVLCDGGGLCTQGCPEGALKLVDGKARLVGDMLCDGLGACIGTCPRGAIRVEEREAVPYDERRVMEANIIPKGIATILAHLAHLKDHGEEAFHRAALEIVKEKGIVLPEAKEEPKQAGCPASRAPFAFRRSEGSPAGNSAEGVSELRQWPIQLHLINPRSSVFQGSNLLLASDCSAFTVGNFHSHWLKGKTLAIACPKLDEGTERYVEKLAVMIDESKIDTLTVLRMQVPCCGGLVSLAMEARSRAGRNIPIKSVTVSPEGVLLEEKWL